MGGLIGFLMLIISIASFFFYAIKCKLEKIACNLVVIGVVFNLIAFFFTLTFAGFFTGRIISDFEECKFNVYRIGSALEKYYKEHYNKYPESLAQLTPKYLKTIPECSATGKDTYSESYTVLNNPGHRAYTVFCSGINHQHNYAPRVKRKFGEPLKDYPVFTSFNKNILRGYTLKSHLLSFLIFTTFLSIAITLIMFLIYFLIKRKKANYFALIIGFFICCSISYFAFQMIETYVIIQNSI